MFGLSDFVSTIIVSILCFLLVVVIVLPNIVKVNEKIWLSLKISLFLILIALIIVFSDASSDTYYFLGSFLGVGFLVRGIVKSSRISLVWFIISFLSFSLVFLSIGQTIFFVICVSYTYILMIGFTTFFLFETKSVEIDFQISIKAQIYSFVILLALPIISIYILIFLSENQVIKFEPVSLYTLFSQNYEAMALVIIFLVFFIIMLIAFLIEFRNKNNQRRDEPWYS